MKFTTGVLLVLATATTTTLAYVAPVKSRNTNHQLQQRFVSTFIRAADTKTAPATTTTSLQMSSEEAPPPATFREAEVLGLKLMQEGQFEQALDVFQKGMKLPGSRSDVVRTKSLSGPSPVGGSYGGTDSQRVFLLDEFELQAAHYNMACAHAQLGNLDEAIMNLQKAFENGFDNFATVRGDFDLDPIKQEPDFLKLMETYDPKAGFNPFGFFGKK